VAVGGIWVGVVVGEGVKLGINVGLDVAVAVAVAVGGIGVGVFDGVAGNSDGVSLDADSAVSTAGLGPGVAMLVALDVGKIVSITGEPVIFDGLHAVNANTISKTQSLKPFSKSLTLFIVQSHLCLPHSKLTSWAKRCDQQILTEK
jgi:hypothetical protein